MNPDELIPIAGNLIIVIFLLLSPLLLARRWFPRSTRMLESMAIPVIGGILLLVLLATAAPYLLVLFIVFLGIGILLGLYRLMQQRGKRKRHGKARSRQGRQAGRHQVVKRPPGRQRQQRRRN